jgi:Pyruvate/2-oxoacid:ferredoxin oxidoreductase delta subunit
LKRGAILGEADVYERLREKISLWPIRTPRTKEVMEILKILFSKEEAEFLTHFTAPYQDPETIEQIVEKTGKAFEEAQAIVNRLVSKGLLFKFTSRRDGKVYYSLMPMVPGIFEFYFSSGGDPQEKQKVGELFERHYMSGGGLEGGASNYPWARVMPIEKTITVNQEISAGHRILPFEKMSEFIKTSRKIAVIKCACRTKKRCQHPIETCMVFDYYADYMVERGFGRYLTVEEALQLLEEMEKVGLVHSTINTQTRPQFICNCCTCACMILRGLTELHNPRAIAKSNFIPIRDEKSCSFCRKCINICPMKANLYHAPHDKEPEKIIFLEERCIGCGLCAYHCPNKAIKMVKIGDFVPEMTPREAFERFERERIH